MSRRDQNKQKWCDSCRSSRRNACRHTARYQHRSRVAEDRPRHVATNRTLHSEANQETDSEDSIKTKEIPGFYYDSTKKRYFKITKEHPGPQQFDIPTQATSIGEKKNEQTLNIKCSRKTRATSCDHVRFLSKREIFGYETERFRRYIRRMSIKSFSLDNKRSADLDMSNTDLEGKVQISKIVPDALEEKVGIMSKIKGSSDSLLQLYNITFTKDFKPLLVLSSTYNMHIGQSTSFCWSPHMETKNYMVLSFIGKNQPNSQIFLFQYADSHCGLSIFRLKNTTAWTSKWNPNPFFNGVIGIGASGYAITTAFDRFSPEKYSTDKSDVFAIEFGKQSSTMYTGSRDGNIRCFDLRLSASENYSKHHWSSFSAGKSIDCLRMLHNDFHLLASTMEGNISLWDLRTNNCIQQYKGHQNTHSLLSFHVDYFEDFITATGEDSVTRIWDLKTTELVHQITCMVSEEDTPIRPTAIFSEQLGEPNGYAGFLYGVKETIYFHPP